MRREELPSAFLAEMEKLLGEEYPAYLESFEQPAASGIRLNTGRVDAEEWSRRSPFSGEPVPWTENGFYVSEADRPARDPYYYAGLYYIQEPSAMTPAALLPVEPGDRVLDLCAAPGGKSTELGAKLRGTGLLFANDISNSRAKALLKNLELFGLPGICVSSEDPEKLAARMPEYFDKILVDAPCSGEGMFRRDESMIRDWVTKGPAWYAPIQGRLIRQAADMLRPGGVMVYSTCTFSPREDEETVRGLLEERPEMELVPIPLFPGAADGFGLSGCLRLFPHRLRGEGHFVAMLRKKGEKGESAPGNRGGKSKRGDRIALDGEAEKLFDVLLEILACSLGRLSGGKPSVSTLRERLYARDGAVYLLPEEIPDLGGIRFLRTGLLLGETKKGRFEPSQPLAMVLDPKAVPAVAGSAVRVLDLDRGDQRVIRYLKGETILLDPGENARGWILVCVDGFPLGWARGNGGSLKNKYYPGWRWQQSAVRKEDI